VTLVMAALVSAQRARSIDRAAIASGLFLGAAFVMKPPAMLFGWLPVVQLVLRARGSSANASRLAGVLARQCASFLALPALTLAYFAGHGALPALYDVLVRANEYYFLHDPPDFGWARVASKTWGAWRDFSPVAPALIAAAGLAVAVSLARGSRRWRPYAAAAAFALGCIASVIAQRKFYLYHWSVLVAPLAMIMTSLARDVAAVPWARRHRWTTASAGVICIALLWKGTSVQFSYWWDSTARTVAWLRGDMRRDEFARTFSEYFFAYEYGDREQVGLWLREHASPDDRLLVRGVAAEIYAVSRLHAPADRFFWTTWLTLPSRAYRRDDWLREDRAAISRAPPRWVVANAHVTEGPESSEWFRPYGYTERTRIGGFIVLERDAATVAHR
jgi:hypothetical protein